MLLRTIRVLCPIKQQRDIMIFGELWSQIVLYHLAHLIFNHNRLGKRKTTGDSKRGITWYIFSTLEDLDFADDIALLSSRRDHIQEKSQRLYATMPDNLDFILTLREQKK